MIPPQILLIILLTLTPSEECVPIINAPILVNMDDETYHEIEDTGESCVLTIRGLRYDGFSFVVDVKPAGDNNDEKENE